tara:strand:- start:1015 stop:1584 length:570 start_codon:yes stop_codon:yes gene_type:complete
MNLIEQFDQLNLILFSLLSLGILGFVDEYFFHHKKDQILKRQECFRENILHIIRLFTFSLIFFFVSATNLEGLFCFIPLGLIALDLVVSILDIFEEKKSRAKMGGLSTAEYFIHMSLSFHLGILYFNYIPYFLKKISLSNEFVAVNIVQTSNLRIIVFSFSLFSLLYFFYQLRQLFHFKKLKHYAFGHK